MVKWHVDEAAEEDDEMASAFKSPVLYGVSLEDDADDYLTFPKRLQIHGNENFTKIS